jgi:hypothetical protein
MTLFCRLANQSAGQNEQDGCRKRVQVTSEQGIPKGLACGRILTLPRGMGVFDRMDRMDGMDEGMAARGGEGTAGFQTDCIADVPIGGARKAGARLSGGRHAGLETRDTADLEVCGTTTGHSDNFFTRAVTGYAPCLKGYRAALDNVWGLV